MLVGHLKSVSLAIKKDIDLMGYREILKAELKKRQALSPKYSLRVFAKELGFSPAHLCYVLQGKKGISGDKAEKISIALGFKNALDQSFRYLILSASVRSRVVNASQSFMLFVMKSISGLIKCNFLARRVEGKSCGSNMADSCLGLTLVDS